MGNLWVNVLEQSIQMRDDGLVFVIQREWCKKEQSEKWGRKGYQSQSYGRSVNNK